ncbi:MAG: hypothetical protein U9N86_15945 [Bacteroidota bacterium]|nr:hypothetical protein [Bacteroidota bacterium]
MAFLKSERPKQFNYIPRFYDEQKEELHDRIKKAKAKANSSKSGEYVPNLKGQFKKKHEALWGQPVKSKGRSMGRWMVLIIYATLVIAILYLIINLLSQLQ